MTNTYHVTSSLSVMSCKKLLLSRDDIFYLSKSMSVFHLHRHIYILECEQRHQTF